MKYIDARTYFDKLYNRESDPWNFSTSDYEHGKYKHTLDALPKKHYGHALEIGCSIGVFTEMLAPRCERLLAMDVSDHPLMHARKRLADYTHVVLLRGGVPEEFPPLAFDLIILSEVGYYLSTAELMDTKELIWQHLEMGGHCCLVHWRPKIEDCALTGDEVHERFDDRRFSLKYHRLNEQYRIDIWERVEWTTQP